MTALGRINLGVSLLFVLVTLAGLALLLRQAGHDVRRELQAVEYLGEVARSNPANLRPELTDNLRHVRVSWLSPGEQPRQQSESAIERWIAERLLGPAPLLAGSWPTADGGSCVSRSIPLTRSRRSRTRCCNCCSAPSP